jgi:hypothetical protein
MDWYLIGRILGVIFWPSAVAVVVYGIGWVVALPREAHAAVVIKRWFRLAAIVGFAATLFITVRDFLTYTGAAG